MKEITNEKLETLEKKAHQIYERENKLDPQFDFHMAVVLGIFAVFNPENAPMEEDDIQDIFTAYLKFADAKLALN